MVKTAGVDESIWKFAGPAKVFDSQDAACEGILGGKVVSGDVVVITHEGPKGGPGMQEMLYPTSYIKMPPFRQGVRADHRRSFPVAVLPVFLSVIFLPKLRQEERLDW